jgi:hypothetical protein
METLIIQTKDAKEIELVQSLLKQNKIKSRLLTDEAKEDIVLIKLMTETNYNEVIDTNTFLNKLRN